jgi:hypothetical protein
LEERFLCQVDYNLVSSEIRWEGYHGAAAKSVYNSTSKRKATQDLDMASSLNSSLILMEVFDHKKTVSYLNKRQKAEPGGILKEKIFKNGAVREAFGDRRWTFDWNYTELHETFPFPSEMIELAKKTYLDIYASEDFIPEEIHVATSVVFESPIESSFSQKGSIRIRTDPDFRSTQTPWYDGMSVLYPQEDKQRDRPLRCGNTQFELHGEYEREFVQARMIISFPGESGDGSPYFWVRKFEPPTVARSGQRDGGYPAPKWAVPHRVIHNWPLLQMQEGPNDSCLVPAGGVEACVYLAKHCAIPGQYWAVIDHDSMPYHEAYVDDDSDLYCETPPWLCELGKVQMAELPKRKKKPAQVPTMRRRPQRAREPTWQPAREPGKKLSVQELSKQLSSNLGLGNRHIDGMQFVSVADTLGCDREFVVDSESDYEDEDGSESEYEEVDGSDSSSSSDDNAVE